MFGRDMAWRLGLSSLCMSLASNPSGMPTRKVCCALCWARGASLLYWDLMSCALLLVRCCQRVLPLRCADEDCSGKTLHCADEGSGKTEHKLLVEKKKQRQPLIYVFCSSDISYLRVCLSWRRSAFTAMVVVVVVFCCSFFVLPSVT